MTYKKKILGITGAHISQANSINEMNFESRRLLEEGEKAFDEVIVIKPRGINYFFQRDNELPQAYLSNGFNLSTISTLITRGTGQIETSINVLVSFLSRCGCDILDPLSRFDGAKSSKINTTLSRHDQHIGTSSFLFFNESNWIFSLKKMYSFGEFPLIMKPVGGRQGNGIIRFNNLDEAIFGIKKAFEQMDNIDEPILLQKLMDFKHEYRVIIINGHVLGVTEKITDKGVIVKNVAQGATLRKVSSPQIKSFVSKYYPEVGILGVDVGVASDNTFHIIEANRAPQWQAFEEATEINVAREIIKSAIKRLE